jgi:hypothetical protein
VTNLAVLGVAKPLFSGVFPVWVRFDVRTNRFGLTLEGRASKRLASNLH